MSELSELDELWSADILSALSVSREFRFELTEFGEFVDNRDRIPIGRRVFFLSEEDISQIDFTPFANGKTFGILIACDFDGYENEELLDFAERMIDAGVSYVCTWGKDCERMHDIIDEQLVFRKVELNEDFKPIVTTWHDDEPLEDTLWFALFSLIPDDEYIDSYESTVIAAVGNSLWNKLVQNRLSNIDLFHDDWLLTN